MKRREPIAKPGEFAYLKVKKVNEVGAFMDMGAGRDLFVPFRHQFRKMQEGKRYVVAVINDELSDGIIGTEKVNDYLETDGSALEVNQEVDLLVTHFSDLGVNVIVDNKYHGLIYKNEIFIDVYEGDRLRGYVKKIREGGKLDISLQKQGTAAIDDNAQFVLEKLRENQGFLRLSDNSDPDEIYRELGISKKLFKKAIGSLYKQRLIEIKENGIKLV